MTAETADPAALLERTIAAIGPLDDAAARAARDHQDRLTKPRGALGVLEDVAIRLAAITGACPPPLPVPAAVVVFAADHGVHAQGETPWPHRVPPSMVINFLFHEALSSNLFLAYSTIPHELSLTTPCHKPSVHMWD